MISFSRDQSSLTPIGLDTQLDFTAVNSQLMSVLNKVPHRLETGLWDPQTDFSSPIVQTNCSNPNYLSQQNGTTDSLNVVTPELASLCFPAGGRVDSIGSSETCSIGQTMRTKISRHKSHGIAMTSKGRRERSKDSNGSVCEIEAKRDALRQRNRIAANKCRRQKRERINELQVKERDLISRKHYLNTVVEILRNELIVLRCKCLEHADCGCERIREHLDDTLAGISPTALSTSIYQDLGEENKYEQPWMPLQQQQPP